MVRRLGVSVPNDELRNCIAEKTVTTRAKWQESASNRQAAIRALLEAYREVLDEGASPDEVYRARLQEYMSLDEWKLRLEYEGTPQRRAALESLLGDQAMLLPDFEAHCKELLLDHEVEKIIDSELRRTDREYADYMHLIESDPAHPAIRDKGPLFLKAKRQAWWQAQYQKAKVIITDEKFHGDWSTTEASSG